MATHSSTPAWRIPWTEGPGGLQSMGSQESDITWQLNHHHCPYYMKVCSSTSAVSLSCCEFSFFLSSSFPFCLALPLTGVHIPMPYTLPLQALGENNGLGKREMRAYADLYYLCHKSNIFTCMFHWSSQSPTPLAP